MKKAIFYTIVRLYFFLKGKRKLVPPPRIKLSVNNKLPDFKFKDITGKARSLAEFSGKKIMFVNVASKCGFTPQYAALQKMYEENNDQLIVIAVPSNQFKKQESGSNEDIRKFCLNNYGITFLMTEKSEVKGINKNEIYKWLSSPEQNGWNSKEPDWNFSKYLIDENGYLIAYYPAQLLPKL